MKRHLIIILFLLIVTLPLYAAHISGGEIFYRYVSPGTAPNTDKFVITLRLFRDCNPTGTQIAPMPDLVTLGIFKKTGLTSFDPFSTISVRQTGISNIQITPSAYPCINPPPVVCYQVGVFETTVDLPKEALGYTIAFQTCCRVNNITNMQAFSVPGSASLGDGATYIATIPGTDILGNTTNSGPQFLIKDTAVVCANNRFLLNFGAVDPDAGDSLSYSFCSAYNRGTAINANESHVPSNPPYNFISYTSGFSGSEPLGSNVTIDPTNGIISGIAPAQGKYVINVCIDEWRKGIKIGEHRKDFILEVRSCNIAGAALDPGYITCDGYTLNFQNLSTSPLVNSWYWDFGVPGTDADISTLATPSFTYPAGGNYNVKLVVNRGQQCSDSTITVAKVYPGFFPGFIVNGSCILNDFTFIDTSTTNFGVINKWTWNFGDETTTTDISTLQNPTWKYSTTGIKQVECIIESSVGCVDTVVVNNTEVRDRPLITLAFRDTLICSKDTLMLNASGIGTYTWTPNQATLLRFNHSPTPEVFPKATTTFKLTLDDNGCVSTDSVQVRVVDFVTLDAGPDTTICLTDSIILNPMGDGLYYLWTPALTLDNPTKRNPIAFPTGNTTYKVSSSISNKCTAEDFITVNTVPYPGSVAGGDATICYGDSIPLSGSINGLTFEWSPQNTLLNANTLTPIAYPLQTTNYVLAVYDVQGCPKPGLDTVIVFVRPKLFINAGNDTSVVVQQPLLLNASGADFFQWAPTFGLSNATIKNPTAILSDDMTYIVKGFTMENCFDYDTINIKVFKTFPTIFVPNAFTPGRTTNNVFRPIPVGISVIDFFSVYNRWGQLVFTSTSTTKGWDGKLKGKDQDPGTYVWMVKGRDYTGKTVFRKGTMVLIR